MKSLALKHVREIKPYQPGKPIEEVRRELGLRQVIKLASNETPFGPSPKVLKAIVDAAKKINRYPDSGCFYLRQALSGRLQVPGNQLIFGNGSDEIIVLAIRAFVHPGDEVIIARPSFLIYDIAAKAAGAKVRSIPLQDFRYDLDGMAAAVNQRTKIIFIGNPDNPAGTYVSERPLQAFLKKIGKKILVFIDEAYFEYVLAKDYPNSIKLLKKFSNVLVARTFSKMYGLAGLRVGYGVANGDVIDILNRLREPFNVNSIAQAAALACLQDQPFYRRCAKLIESQRQVLYRDLEALDLRIVKTVTNFILVDVKQKSQNVARRLLERGVIVRDMGFWGLDTFLRVTIGTDKENEKFIKVLREIL